MFIFSEGSTDQSIAAEAAALRALSNDLRHLARGSFHGTARDAAPLLQDYGIAMMAVPRLVGRVSGHPLLPGEGRAIASSQLWLVSSDGEWARTRSRWYRLGTPISRDPADGSDAGHGA